MFDDQDFSTVIEEHFSYDGPHTPENVIAAARGVSELVRYLTNATGPGNQSESLRSGPTARQLLGALADATSGLDQLLEQVAGALESQAQDPSLIDDRGRDYVGAETATTAALQLDEAHQAMAVFQQRLGDAFRTASHLGHDVS